MRMRKTTVKTLSKQNLIAAAWIAALAIASAEVCAQQSDEELAKAAQNPIAALISVPFQYNYDHEIGPQEAGHKNYVNVQPVIPFSVNDDWNLISRTIVPVVWQQDIFPGSGSQSGIGDITQSFFFSPKKPTADGWIWGAGPVIYLPTGSDSLLSAEKWGLGPTAVLLKQEHGWTYGALVNHIWSTGGAGTANINSTFLQPFLTYTTQSHTSFTLQTESSYNWEANSNRWSVPVHFLVAQLFRIGNQPLQFQIGARYWATSPDSGAHGWGVRSTLTLLFPANK
jgi:hypothetical protein